MRYLVFTVLCLAGVLKVGTVKAGESGCSHALELDKQEAIEWVTIDQLPAKQATKPRRYWCPPRGGRSTVDSPQSTAES